MAIALEMKQQLAKLLAKPSLVGPADAELLTMLVQAYPYYQPLHLLLAKANIADQNPNHLAKAALYNGGALLHQALYQPESFASKSVNVVSVSKDVNIQGAPNIETNRGSTTPNGHEFPGFTEAESGLNEEIYEEIAEVNAVSSNTDRPELSEHTQEENQHDEEIYEEIGEVNAVSSNTDRLELSEHTQEENQRDEEIFEEIGEVNTVSSNTDRPELSEHTQEENQHDEEIFEEIAEVNAVSSNTNEPELSEHTQEENQHDEEIHEEIVTHGSATNADAESEEQIFDEIGEVNAGNFQIENKTNEKDSSAHNELLPDELAIESIVSTDFFAFEQRFSSDPSETSPNTFPVTFNPPEEYNTEAEAQTVSKYDDDKLPYTFLWWLAKTRKEHAQIFQPYVAVKKDPAPVAGQLQQQYVEHIFHLQTPFNIADEAKKTTSQSVAHKGEDIIDSFIKNEPQIGAPKPELINNENKAKKSAEDSYDLVSETLASIYIEQMLYHKAIDTYEKLSLKFPEKSRYFADLIQSLEKKI